MYQLLDANGKLDLAAAIEALAGSTFVGLEGRELGFPESQDVGFDTADAGNVANAEVEPVGDLRRRWLGTLSG
jgi:hypothetical protein